MVIFSEVGVVAGVVGTIIAILSYNWARAETVSMEFPFTMSIEPSVRERNPGAYRSPTFPSDASKVRFNNLRFSVMGGAPGDTYLCAVSNLEDVQRLTNISNRPGDGQRNDIAYFDEEDIAGFVYISHLFLKKVKSHPNATIENWDSDAQEYAITINLNTDMVDDFYCVFVNEGDDLITIEGVLTAEVKRTPISKFVANYRT